MYLGPTKIKEIINNKRNPNDLDMIRCSNCNGTGLKYTGTVDNPQWDGVSFCDSCEGVGFWDWIEYIMRRKK
jgi:hypothetical protein